LQSNAGSAAALLLRAAASPLLPTGQLQLVKTDEKSIAKKDGRATDNNKSMDWTRRRQQSLRALRLSATVTPKFFPLYHFFPLFFPLFFHLPQRFPLNTPPIPHYHYKISFSIPTINFLSTNNYLWTHSTVFRVINSDTLDLGGKRRGPTRRGRCRGHRCGHRVPPTA
jgi:hypothetical protein